MNKTNLLIVIIILSAAFFCASTGVASAISLNDKYVGNTVVDLEWSKYWSEDFSKYKLCRDDAPIHTEFNRNTTFYRDGGRSKGVTYDYKIEVYNATGGLVDWDTQSVTTGDVHGWITQSTTWTAATSPYDLTGSVTVDENATLTIQSGVTVNNGQHPVRGTIAPLDTVTFNGEGIYLEHVDGYSIKNCVFDGTLGYSHKSIELHECNNCIISNNDFVDGSGIRLYKSSHNTLTGNTANIWTTGIGLSDSSHNTLTGNTVNNSGGDGIYLHKSSHNTLTGNTANNNSRGGIFLSYSSNNIFTSNSVNNNSGDGISLSYSSNNIFTSNSVNNNSGVDKSGIYVSHSSNNTFTSNTVNNNNVGIELEYSSNNNIFTSNTANNNGFGISLSGSNNTFTSNTVDNNSGYGIVLMSESSNNTFTGNTFNNNGADGIHLFFPSNNTFTSNTVNNNSGNGIYLFYSSNSTLTDNTVNNNGDDGIYLHYSSSNTLTSNSANNNNAYGICLGSNNTLSSNTANNNTNDGISIRGDNNTLTGSEITCNGGNGIFADRNVKIEGATEIHDNGGWGIYTEGGNVDIHDGAMSSINRNGKGGIWSIGGLKLPANFVVDDNGGPGIVAGGGIVGGVVTDTLILERVKVRNNKGDGIGVLGGLHGEDANLVIKGIGNEITNNEGNGIYATLGGSITIQGTGAEIQENGGWGILSGLGKVDIRDGAMSSVNKNEGGGIKGMAGVLLPPNFVVDGNGGPGIVCGGEATLSLESVKVRKNGGNGISVLGGLLGEGGNVVIKGTDSKIHNNAGWGILAEINVDIRDAEITNNGNGGIQLHSSSHGTLTDNTVSNNGGYGIYLSSCSENTIYNNIFNNPKNAYDDGNNTWNLAKTEGTNIIGGRYLGGNGWSDYRGKDLDEPLDGLGDTMLPYNSLGDIKNGGDYHPISPCCTETDTDGDCVDDTVDKCVGIPDATNTCGLPDDCLGYEYCSWMLNSVVKESSPGSLDPKHEACGSGSYLVSETCVKYFVTCSDVVYEYWNDPDDDDDGWCDEDCPTCYCCEGVDNCPTDWNPDQADVDGDGWGDLCDPYPDIPNKVDTATGMGPAIFTSDTGELKKLKAVDEATLPEEGKPDCDFSYGFFSFNAIPNSTVTITIELPSPVPVGTEYWKYGPTPDNSTDHWYQIPLGSDDGDNVITITLEDGGLGDDDCIENGVIVDQGGPGIPGAPPNITAFAPPSPVNDTVCNWRTFNVTVNQTVNVSWYLNNTRLHTNVSTKEASYTLHAEVVGEHNGICIANLKNHEIPQD